MKLRDLIIEKEDLKDRDLRGFVKGQKLYINNIKVVKYDTFNERYLEDMVLPRGVYYIVNIVDKNKNLRPEIYLSKEKENNWNPGELNFVTYASRLKPALK